MAAADDTYLMMVDGKVQAVDLSPMMRRHRAVIVKARAAAKSQVVEALAVESIDMQDLLDASGLDERGREDACYLALQFKLIELDGDAGD